MKVLILRRFGLQAGDKVKPTMEYEQLFNKSFYGTILFFDGEIATVLKDNGERTMLDCYWLEKVEIGAAVEEG